jgi:uncharacterized coiled-coil protein SlyX
MARIEVSLEEYNKWKNDIAELEKQNFQNEKTIQELNLVLTDIYEELNDLVEETCFFNRVFQWEKITRNARKILDKYGKK